MSFGLKESQFDFIREDQQESPGSKWGWIMYRCTYGDDEKWSRFMEKLNSYVREQAEDQEASNLLNTLDWSVQEDSTLEGASTQEIRRRFQAWAQSGAETPDGTPRFNHCLMATEEVVNSVLDGLGPETINIQSTAHVIIVDKNWESTNPPPGEEDPEDAPHVYEPIEGYTDYCVGWMKVQVAFLLPNFYNTMRDAKFENRYERPPKVNISDVWDF